MTALLAWLALSVLAVAGWCIAKWAVVRPTPTLTERIAPHVPSEVDERIGSQW